MLLSDWVGNRTASMQVNSRLSAAVDTSLVRGKGEHLAIAADDLAGRADYRGGVVKMAIIFLENRARQNPHAMVRRQFGKLLFDKLD